jgi:hypothetical protein
MGLEIAFYLILSVLSLIICYQDFKSRLVSAWLLIAYVLVLILGTMWFSGGEVLLQNAVSAFCYFLLCGLGVFTYYFLKERQIPKIMDSKFGWADALVCFGIGISLNIISLILFFTGAFIISAVIGLILQQKNKTVPLAGILVILHLIFICISAYFPLDLML